MPRKTSNPAEEQATAPVDRTRRDEDIRTKVKELASQALKGGQMDPKGVEDVVRSVTGAMGGPPPPPTAEARKALLEDIEGLQRRLKESAEAAQLALAQIGAKGVDFTENDVKQALAMFRELHEAYALAAARVADAASGNIQRELRALAGHGELMGTEMGARAASVMTEFANRLTTASRETAASGLGTARDYSVRMSMLASGVLAGIADALREPAATDKKE